MSALHLVCAYGASDLVFYIPWFFMAHGIIPVVAYHQGPVGLSPSEYQC